MNKIYLLIIDIFNTEENSIVDICTTREKAEELMNQYTNNAKESGESEYFNYHIDEVDLDSSKEILWDCYDNSSLNIK